MHVTTVFPRFFATLNCTWQSQEALHGTSDRFVCNSASSYTLSKAVLSVSMVTYVQTPKMDVSCYLLPQNSWRCSTDSGTDSKKDRPEALSHHIMHPLRSPRLVQVELLVVPLPLTTPAQLGMQADSSVLAAFNALGLELRWFRDQPDITL